MTVVLKVSTHKLEGYSKIFTIWLFNIAMENGPVEIVYLPIIIAMVIFQLANC